MSFDVSDEVARRIRGVVGSGREVAVIFCCKARRVIEVRVKDVWANHPDVRSFATEDEGHSVPPARAGRPV